MDKQEVIERLNNKLDEVFAFQRSFEPLTGAYMECESKASAYMIAINYVEQLDEPHKPVVPKFVAEWFEDNKHALDLTIFIAIRGLNDEEWPHKTDFENWLDVSTNKPIETLIRMKDGYEVEKEPLYTVTINLDLKYHLVVDEGDGNDEIITTLTTTDGVFGYRYFLTEKEIKSADENLWLFAVPVEEVAEGFIYPFRGKEAAK